jgi:hypothetical protein
MEKPLTVGVERWPSSWNELMAFDLDLPANLGDFLTGKAPVVEPLSETQKQTLAFAAYAWTCEVLRLGYFTCDLLYWGVPAGATSISKLGDDIRLSPNLKKPLGRCYATTLRLRQVKLRGKVKFFSVREL